MSLLRILDRTSAVSNATQTRPFLRFLCPSLETTTPKRSFGKRAINRRPQLTTAAEHMESFFIQALVRAGSCREHAKHLSTLRKAVSPFSQQPKSRRKSTWRKHGSSDIEAGTKPKGPFGKVRKFAEDELRALVDYYGMDLDPKPEEEVPDDGSLIWNVGDTHQPWPLRDEADAVHIKRLEELLQDEEAPYDDVFDTYKKLQSPGVVYLKLETIRALLHHMSIVERPTPIAMQRFLSILDDMKTAHIHIIRSEWTSAIHLAGRAMGNVSANDLQSALYIWRDMELRAGVRGGYVTLNVLFDVAVKAGNYTLAETFLKELQVRKLEMHRHFRVSLLYYYGVRQDGNRVRKTYQELVSAGDIVDTVVMNAVIASLFRAGEHTAAEHVFERMKRLDAQKSPPAPGHRFFNRNWRDRRAVGLLLTYEARRLNKLGAHEEVKNLQAFTPIAPDSRTYALLIRHHARIAGNIDRVDELLKEMRSRSIPLNGTIFIVIFHGFNSFGGVRYTSWTPDKLEKIWTQYLKALRGKAEDTWISSMSVVAALKAFTKCTNPERTLEAWEEIRKLWQPNEEELENVMRVLRKGTGTL